MRHEITGDNLQQVTVTLNPGESVYAEAGAMVNMSGNMNMNTEVKGGLLPGDESAAQPGIRDAS